MQIYVNEQELDAELGGEKNLEEVYEAVNRWTTDNKKYILSLKVDHRDVSVAGLSDVGTEEVERVDFYIGDEMDMVLSTLGEMDRYVDQIGEVLFEQDKLTIDDSVNLKDGVHWMRQIMTSVSTILHLDLSEVYSPMTERNNDKGPSVEHMLATLETVAGEFNEQTTREDIEGFLLVLRDLKMYLMGLITQLRSMSAGREELLESVEEFEMSIPKLTEQIVSINEAFGAGKDGEALGSLERVTEQLNQYVASLFALDHQMGKGEDGLGRLALNGISFQEQADALTGLLRDLSSALEESDIVAAGDILEYELTDKLVEIRPYLSEIRSMSA